jgi:hypothetical protein
VAEQPIMEHIENFSLERLTDREIWVKHHPDGHMFEFVIESNDGRLASGHTFVPNPLSPHPMDLDGPDDCALVESARAAASELVRRNRK